MSQKSYTPILEIYKVRISHRKRKTIKSFQNVFEEKFSQENSEFKDFIKEFVQHFEKKDEYVINNFEQKGFTIATEDENHKIRFDNKNHIIHGVISGGKYGKKRKKGTLGDISKSEVINYNDLILDDFYFLFYAPYGKSTGILLIQKYTTENITNLFKEHISKFFHIKDGQYNKVQFDIFIPKEIESEFKKNSVINKVVYTTNMPSQEYVKSSYGSLSVKVIIESKSGIPKEEKDTFLDKLGLSMFNNTELKEFKTTTGYLLNPYTKKSVAFKLQDDFKLKPIIDLESEGIELDEFGVPNFALLHKYCLNLLEGLKKDNSIYPNHEVKEL
ncbi:Uncharacterised protein [Algoriella xinjiangensis]|uniref:hypothetical protein n=1 Tax=Algoriella xinjiangensis TaxID=684065 RepID=UPI000F63F015|nr:hypothetical protein [Algoriella xinjiangensis]VDH16152.1 Uncharacterised protein [Algoriella xinjiangensis]